MKVVEFEPVLHEMIATCGHQIGEAGRSIEAGNVNPESLTHLKRIADLTWAIYRAWNAACITDRPIGRMLTKR
jgi:hypothetical protein